MPEGMPANVSQGFIFRAIGEKLNSLRLANNTADLGTIKTELEALDSNGDPQNRLPQMAKNWTGTVLRGKDVNHLRRHWFGTDARPPGREDAIWWREAQPIDPIIRAGMVELIDKLVAATTNSRTDFYWVCAGHAMEFIILEHKLNNNPGDIVFTVLVLTPTLPGARRHRVPEHEDDYQFGPPEPITVIRPSGIGPSEVDPGGTKGKQFEILKPLSLEKK